MGFIDLSGSLGRHFGSIGVALHELATHLSLTGAGQRHITGVASARAHKCLTQFCETFAVSDHLELVIHRAIPAHVGLGSGTSISLAIGAALNAYYGLGLSVRDIASVMDRGLRSGIGIGVFEHGGLVVDGGRGEKTVIPPLLAQFAVPDDWRFILVFDQRGQGLHGQQEISAFQQLPPFPRSEAERLCYLLLMQALPAIAEHDIRAFGVVITELQQAVGKHFASVQGGIFTSSEVAAAMQWLAAQGAVALGQTSWGPTGFCAVADPALAEQLVQEARQVFANAIPLSFMVCRAQNTGSEVLLG